MNLYTAHTMKRRTILWKKSGETPLQAIEAWKREHPDYMPLPATYAGRLDPMAEGKLLVLFGEECKRQKQYHALDKEYEIEVLFDIESDTGDALGLASLQETETVVEQEKLSTVLKQEQGVHERAYPIFSSKTVQGKPLFLHALEGTIGAIEIPTHTEHLYTLSVQERYRLDSDTLKTRIEAFLSRVPKTNEPSKMLGADFRITEVRESWMRVFAHAKERSFAVLKLRVECASGAYMRTLASRIGEAFQTKALALSIKRTRIGKRYFGMFFDIQ